METTEISVRGKFLSVPAIDVDGTIIAIQGKLMRTGFIKGEVWLDPRQVCGPERIIESLRSKKAPLDIFCFRQLLPEFQPKFRYYHEWEDIAAIPLTSFAEWWEKRASQVTRKNIRRSAKRGLTVSLVGFDDRLIEAIVRINNDSPFRTGRKFWHFGKDFDSVKKDYSAYLDRSEFLGAFYEDEMVGFLRLVHQGEVSSVMQLLSMKDHYDKRPSNALIAKAVEICIERGKSFLIYGNYFYDDNIDNPLTEFKRRCGFEKILVPVYYVPFSLRGRIAIKLRLHAGIRRIIPRQLKDFARATRNSIMRRQAQVHTPSHLDKEEI